MPRIAIVLAAVSSLAAALAPAHAAADAPPPDRFTPCDGLSAGAGCYAAGCTCVEVTGDCPGGAATCLSCQNGAAWCGPTNYHPHDTSYGCASAPAGAAALGLVGLVLLGRRRGR